VDTWEVAEAAGTKASSDDKDRPGDGAGRKGSPLGEETRREKKPGGRS